MVHYITKRFQLWAHFLTQGVCNCKATYFLDIIRSLLTDFSIFIFYALVCEEALSGWSQYIFPAHSSYVLIFLAVLILFTKAHACNLEEKEKNGLEASLLPAMFKLNPFFCQVLSVGIFLSMWRLLSSIRLLSFTLFPNWESLCGQRSVSLRQLNQGKVGHEAVHWKMADRLQLKSAMVIMGITIMPSQIIISILLVLWLLSLHWQHLSTVMLYKLIKLKVLNGTCDLHLTFMGSS